ncbi:Nn.00g045000.m01.CDS01 [Neocucurbitaria sp. VM-36]
MTRSALCNDQIKRDEDDARLAFDFTPEELQRSAFDEGCDSCLMILEGLRQSETPDWSLQRDIRRVYARCQYKRLNFQETLRLEVYFMDDRPKLELEFYSLQPHAHETQAWKAILPRPSVSGHPLSVRALELPKRVLYISGDDDNNIKARLVQDGDQRSDYVALSHCWGTEQTCTTTKITLTDRTSGIPWETMSKTFQHAIKLALKLGFNYIWIDSLCIIQDDAIDWEIESSRMAEIYQNAAMTLAATSSMGDHMGCYTEDVQAHGELELNLPEDVGACRIAVRRPLEHWAGQTANGLNTHFPLLTRGWAFQERLLCARVLHICHSELIWECREINACECGGLGEDTSPGEMYYHAVEDNREEKRQYEALQQKLEVRRVTLRIQQEEDSRAEKSAQESMSEPAPPSYEDVVSSTRNYEGGDGEGGESSSGEISDVQAPVYQDNDYEAEFKECPDLVFHFHRIVEQYSSLQLTKTADRLPALSGLCRRVQDLRGDYLAGLWSDSICFDLMWRVNIIKLDLNNGTRPSDYRGPSWSWVSVDSPVSYWTDILNFRVSENGPRVWRRSRFAPNNYEHVLVEKGYTSLGQHDDKVIPIVWTPGKNPFGSVTFGLLTVEASTVHARLEYTTNTSYWTGGSATRDISRYKLSISGSELPFFADYALAAEGPHNIPHGTQLTLLLVHPKVCLVLHAKQFNGAPLTFDGEAVMQRVGIVRISETLLQYYRIDWMRGSEVKKIRIM